MRIELFKMVFYYESGAMTDLDIIQWAMNQVVNGNESGTVSELAALLGNEQGKAKPLLKQAFSDMGLSYPSQEDLALYRMKLICEEIAGGKIPQLRGCQLLEKGRSVISQPQLLGEAQELIFQLADERFSEKAPLIDQLIRDIEIYLSFKD